MSAASTLNRHRKVTHADWAAKGRRLFGADWMAWRFRCPACGHVATVQQWKDAGAGVGEAGYSCVGRHFPAPREAFAKGPGPCNYAGGGLIGLNPVRVIYPNGKTIDVFEFAVAEEPLK